MRSNIRTFLKNARESSTLAIGVYNNPSTVFRSRGFIVMMSIAWDIPFSCYIPAEKSKSFLPRSKTQRALLKGGWGKKGMGFEKVCLRIFGKRSVKFYPRKFNVLHWN